MSVLVYALTSPSARRLSTTGITGERLHRVRVGAIDAIVSSPSAVPRPTERHLRKYDRTMSALWRRTTALLPVRFGTAVADVSELERLLTSHQPGLRRRLHNVRNRAQMNVRVLTVPNPPPSPEASARPARAATGADYLRARARAVRDVPGFEPVRNAVKTWVRDERVENRAGVASVYHLVPSGSVNRYRIALEAAARAADLRVVVTGPWPPYAFAGEEF